MELVHSVAADVAVTVNDRCHMSCEVDGDETRFQFGSDTTGLRLDFDWRGFVRFMRVASTVIEQLRVIPDGVPIDFVVTATDDDSGDIIAALRMTPDKDYKSIQAVCPSLPKSPTAARSDTTREQQLSTAGISSYPYVTVNGNGALTCEVLPDQIELRFGNNDSGLQFLLNYLGFAKFMWLASSMVKKLQAIPDGERIDFEVTANDHGNNEQATLKVE
jgi:hypothetical protein